MLFFRDDASNDHLQEARKELTVRWFCSLIFFIFSGVHSFSFFGQCEDKLFVLQGFSMMLCGNATIGIKILGEIDIRAFLNTCKKSFLLVVRRSH